jgi:hypothetical protein
MYMTTILLYKDRQAVDSLLHGPSQLQERLRGQLGRQQGGHRSRGQRVDTMAWKGDEMILML